nr:hypothetical protein [Tanacetum cinerariifolium]
KRSRQETHISQQQSGSGTGEGTGSKQGVSDVPSDDSEEELSWKSSDDEEVGSQEEGNESNDDSDDGSDKDSEETVKSRAEQESRLRKEARLREEDAEELYRDVNINQGRGLQITQSVEDTHVILTPVNPDDPQESSSMSSFVSSIATITTSGEAPIPPPTIPSIILENLPTFNSAFRFEERLRLLETSFNEYRQTNQFADAMSTIPGIVHQYVDQQMKEAVREAVQKQTDQLQDLLQ